jgi:hypothetical protein
MSFSNREAAEQTLIAQGRSGAQAILDFATAWEASHTVTPGEGVTGALSEAVPGAKALLAALIVASVIGAPKSAAKLTEAASDIVQCVRLMRIDRDLCGVDRCRVQGSIGEIFGLRRAEAMRLINARKPNPMVRGEFLDEPLNAIRLLEPGEEIDQTTGRVTSLIKPHGENETGDFSQRVARSGEGIYQ